MRYLQLFIGALVLTAIVSLAQPVQADETVICPEGGRDFVPDCDILVIPGAQTSCCGLAAYIPPSTYQVRIGVNGVRTVHTVICTAKLQPYEVQNGHIVGHCIGDGPTQEGGNTGREDID